MVFSFVNLIKGGVVVDTLDLHEVEIFGNRIDNNAGYKIYRIDTVYMQEFQSQALSELISSVTPVFIKSYGHGSLATSSIRGASATHTQVLWNGVNINSPMPGQSDFSQIPVFFADKATVDYGAGSIFQTSGGLGGSISLNTVTDWKNRFGTEVQQEFAGFNTFRTLARINAGNSRLQSTTRLFFVTSENDYRYSDIAADLENPPVKTRQNASYRQKGLLQEFAWKPADKTTLTVRLWLQDNFREIPPNMLVTVPDGNESLSGQIARGILEANHAFARSVLKVQTGILWHFFNYQNQISLIDDDNTMKSWVNSAKYVFYGVRNLTLTAAAEYNHHSVISDNFNGRQIRNEANVSLGAGYSAGGRTTVNLFLRQDMINGVPAPFIPSLGVNFKVLKKNGLYLKANMARNFHAPTLNDLYWSPGGNPSLGNESGFTWETGLLYKEAFRYLSVNTQLTWFHADINNWILWQPDTVFSYWTPSNLKNVVSKGVEFSFSANGIIGKTGWNYSLQYAYTSAQNMHSFSDDDLSTGKQLIYVPENSVSQHVGVEWSGFTFGWTLNFTGKRFTTSDNSRYLPSFVLNDIMISKMFNAGRSKFRVQFNVNNLANTQYQVVAWQPMPGRNFSFSVKYIFNTKKN